MVKSSVSKVGDLVKMELDRRYTRRNKAFTAVGSSLGNFSPLGALVDAAGNEVAAASQANAKGVVVTDDLIADGDKVNFIERGPAIINKGALRTADTAGASYTMATVVSTLEALGIRVVDEIAVTETQTT